MPRYKFVVWDGSEDEGEEQSDVELDANDPIEARELCLDEFLDGVRIIEAFELSERDGMVAIDYKSRAFSLTEQEASWLLLPIQQLADSEPSADAATESRRLAAKAVADRLQRWQAQPAFTREFDAQEAEQ